jgi:glycosyltransferase involved in cell wall biosynthesis
MNSSAVGRNGSNSASARLAFIVHSFNRCANVDQLAAGLKKVGSDQEIIVCDDGSIDGSREKWKSYLKRSNEFLVLSNDLHEIRLLDRAIQFTSADIACIVQDDDRIPEDTGWLDQVLEAFDRFPDLAIIGGFMGFYGFDTDPRYVRRIWGERPFEFVEHVNIGPYFVRRSHYCALGGWDYAFSGAGEPGICFDNELCLRAWSKGYQVGYLFIPFKGPAGKYSRDGGTQLFTPVVRRANQLRNERRISDLYGRQAATISKLVCAANRSAFMQQGKPGLST